jgi:hypothetical protein
MQNNNLEESLTYIVEAILKDKVFFTNKALLRFMNEKNISDQTNFIKELRKKLLVIADTEDAFWPAYTTPSYESVHLNLLNLACYWPVNNPLSVLPENLFLTATGCVFDLAFSGRSIKESRDDSATRQQFNARDREEVAALFQLSPKRNASWATHGLAAFAGSLGGMLGGTLVTMIVAVVVLTLPVSWAFVGAFVGLALGFCAAVALTGLVEDIKNTCSPHVPAKRAPQLERLKEAEDAARSEVELLRLPIQRITLPGVAQQEVDGKKEQVSYPVKNVSPTAQGLFLQYKPSSAVVGSSVAVRKSAVDMTADPLSMPQPMIARRG